MVVVTHPCKASDVLKILGENPGGKHESSKARAPDRGATPLEPANTQHNIIIHRHGVHASSCLVAKHVTIESLKS